VTVREVLNPSILNYRAHHCRQPLMRAWMRQRQFSIAQRAGRSAKNRGRLDLPREPVI
jgi:hypothetical protein